jgi:Taurine catabolism dioxygenase TauD, TfdA family
MSGAQPLAGRAAWHGKELERSVAWIRTLDHNHLAEIDAALAQVQHRPPFGFDRDDFPLNATADMLAGISDELENGLGAVRLRGLPVDRYSDDDIRRIFWGLGRHLGTPLYQNARGEIMGEVRDETKLSEKTYAETEPGRIVSSRARARSTGPLRWHTDRCDIIALLCVRNAKAGGISKLTSIVTIYNEILRRRPDLLDLLCQDYWRARPADEDGIAPSRAFALPVFGVQDGKRPEARPGRSFASGRGPDRPADRRRTHHSAACASSRGGIHRDVAQLDRRAYPAREPRG